MVGGLGPDRLSGGDGDDNPVDGAGEFRQDRSVDILRAGAGSDTTLALSGSKANGQGAGPPDRIERGPEVARQGSREGLRAHRRAHRGMPYLPGLPREPP